MLEKEPDKSNNKYGAWSATMLSVKGYTVGPNSTIVFPDFPDQSITKTGKNEYSIESYVDYRDYDGNEIRKNFSCKAVYVKNRWEIKDINTRN
jgi:hypothetical protein